MFTDIQRFFAKIGADVQFVTMSRRTRGVRLDVKNQNGREKFQIGIPRALIDANALQLAVQEVRSTERHLVLVAMEFDQRGNVTTKEHFLCGHDERHLFVAAVRPVSTVAEAKASLKPAEIRDAENGMNNKKRNRRKTPIFRRQGEWFFVPADIVPPPFLVRRNEPLVRGRGSKPHIAQFAYRSGGETVYVCRQHPNGVTADEYKRIIEQPKAKNYIWRVMQRNATVYVMGTIRHPDHATIVLGTWHRVLMNTEARSESVAFLD